MVQLKSPSKVVGSRVIALDYLRGFFILVIIADHLWRWPNLFQFVSGRGELWASAAEGFVIISGLLVGYIRGFKDREKPLGAVSTKLVKRGVMLYIWMVITTLVLVGVSWALNFKGAIAYVPIPAGHWNELIVNILQFNYVHTLTHFLYLYAIFLVLSPLIIWLLRHGKAWMVIGMSITAWLIGVKNDIEWLQWQVLFFLPATAGFYFEALTRYYHQLSLTIRHIIRIGAIAITGTTAVIAANIILPTVPGSYEDSLFGRDPITLATVLTSFVWFLGLFSLFQFLLPYLKRYLGWLLQTFGERSLTAYILHTIPLVLCQLLFVDFNNFWLNSLLAISCILFTWGLLKIPGINKVIPR
jgi:hypothetical protein